MINLVLVINALKQNKAIEMMRGKSPPSEHIITLKKGKKANKTISLKVGLERDEHYFLSYYNVVFVFA